MEKTKRKGIPISFPSVPTVPTLGNTGGPSQKYRKKMNAAFVLLLLWNLSFETNAQTIIPFAGLSSLPQDDAPATLAIMSNVYVALDQQANYVIVDGGNHRLRRVNITTGKIYILGGNGTAGYRGDGGAATGAL